jgi:hypothetical protein
MARRQRKSDQEFIDRIKRGSSSSIWVPLAPIGEHERVQMLNDAVGFVKAHPIGAGHRWRRPKASRRGANLRAEERVPRREPVWRPTRQWNRGADAVLDDY